MDELFILRLDTMHEQLKSLLKTIEDLLHGEEETIISEKDIQAKSNLLSSSIVRFSSEIHTFMEKGSTAISEKIVNYTETQLKAETLKAELEATITTSKKDKETQKEISNTKLPKLTLPKYNGDLLSWTEFWDRFDTLIHSKNLPEVDKLSYLVGCLEGEALRAIEGLSITHANYNIAVTTLRGRFGKKDIIVDAHYDVLHKLPQSSSTADSCRSTLNTIERHLRVLESLDERVDSNNLRAVITSKFPQQIIYQLNMIIAKNNIEEIRNGLDKIITAMEKAKGVAMPSTSQDKTATTEALNIGVVKLRARRGDKYKKIRHESRYPKETPYTNNKRKFSDQPLNKMSGPPMKKQKIMKCIFCDEQNHFNDACSKYKSIQERKKRLNDRCLVCFRRGHWAKTCTLNKLCFYCKGKHNRALCPKRELTEGRSEGVANTKGRIYSNERDIQTTKIYSSLSTFTCLQTATATIQNKTKEIKCRILLDTGSQRSYISNKIMKKLNQIPDSEERLLIFTFGKETPEEKICPSAEIKLITKRNIIRKIRMNVVPFITKKIPIQQMPSKIKLDIHGDDPTAGEEIDILIGNNYYSSFIRTGKIKINENLYIIDTDFGWVLSGISEDKENYTLQVITQFAQCYEMDLPYFTEPDLPLKNTDVKFLWSLESIGITDSPKTTREEEAVKHFNDTVIFENNRYHVKWPWSDYPPDLPTNYGLAVGRLVSLIRRLDNSTVQEYDRILKEQLQKDIIEVLDPQPVKIYQTSHPVHYLPHHIIQQEGKAGRIVYDASAKLKDQKSLNECLFRGPSMLGDLTALLLKFRMNKIGILADVEKAFLQVGLQEEDRDVTRFLWLKDINKPVCEDNLIHLRFCRVPFGIISSPFILSATIKHHLTNSNKELVKQIADKFYVDNLVTGTESVEQAYQLYMHTRKTFEELSMNIREWNSNDENFLEKVTETHKSKDSKTTKVLGLIWNTKEDSLQLKFNDNMLMEDSIMAVKNKRDILSVIAAVYDPCGFAAPLMLPAKLFLQDLWKRKYNWDTHLTKDLLDNWRQLAKGLRKAKDIKLNRFTGHSTDREKCNELHCFADSSKDAYAAIIYLRICNKNETKISFLMAKSRIAPLEDKKNLQIPRLELMGAVIGARLLKFVKDALEIPIKDEYLWLDSQVVLSWLTSTKLLAPFVANRVNEIKQNKRLHFRYINTELNPADVATRCDTWDQKQKLWLNGPSFLMEEEEHWPQNSYGNSQITNCAVEEGLVGKQPDVEINDILQIRAEDKGKTGIVSELRKLQEEYFPEEVAGKETNLTRNLNIYMDVDGVLRCKGRMKYTNWTYDMKHPILIPKQSSFTEKIIKEVHEKYYHVGTAHTLSIIRQHYWIPQGRAQVQKIIRHCPNCTKHGGGPYKLPSPPDLSAERVNFSPAFTFSGIDYFGPMFIKTRLGNEKRWICLYTCLAVRAIHLEVVQNLTADECLMALRRFIASRGLPKVIVSDNALYFKLTAEVLAAPYCVQNNLRWKFIPALAPWHGGFYERLVGIVKHCLKRTLEKHQLNETQLTTVIKEVEAVVNTRPLTSVSSELDHVLKPSDFLTLGNCLMPTITEDNFQPIISTKEKLIDGWRKGQKIIEEFKHMFSSQYLSSLRERFQHNHKQPRTKSSKQPQIGDIVQIKNDSKNRENWKVGKITSLLKGQDGEIRVAKVKIDNQEFTRSINHLYPLEIEDNEEENKELERNTTEELRQSIEEHTTEPDSVRSTEFIGKDNGNDESKQENSYSSLPESIQQIEITHEPESIEEVDMIEEPENINLEELRSFSQPMEEDIPEVPDDDETLPSKRQAAIKARQKIAEWTRQLVSLL